MSITRCLVALLLAGSIGGCASTGAGFASGHGRAATAPASIGATEALDLLRLVEHVAAAAVAAEPGNE